MFLEYETLTIGWLELKQRMNWSDDLFFQLLTTCNVPREAISLYFDYLVYHGGMVELGKLPEEVKGRYRKAVMATRLNQEEQRQLGKCMAFLEQVREEV